MSGVTPLQSELAYYFHVLVKELKINKPYYTANEISTYLNITERSVFNKIADIKRKCNIYEVYKIQLLKSLRMYNILKIS